MSLARLYFDGDENLAVLDHGFPHWTCECKRIHAFTYPDDAAQNPVTCPECDRVYDGEPWYWTWTDNTPSVVFEHACWPHWHGLKDKDANCIMCGEKIVDPYEFWTCACKQAHFAMSQSAAVLSPLHCGQCGRVWDGRDWFKSSELYNTIILWEDICREADALLNKGQPASHDREQWILELMDYCDSHMSMDPTVFWRLDRALDACAPLSADQRATIESALESCRPIMALVWHRAKSTPSDPMEWRDIDSPTDPAILRLHQPARPGGVGWVLRPQQQEIVDVIRAADRRLTQGEISTALAKRGRNRGDGWAKNTLSPLVQFSVLNNLTDSRGKGYGLPEWVDSHNSASTENVGSRDRSRDQ
jgi:hypothetical protein